MPASAPSLLHRRGRAGRAAVHSRLRHECGGQGKRVSRTTSARRCLRAPDRRSGQSDRRSALCGVPPSAPCCRSASTRATSMALACELLGGALSGGGTWHYEESKQQRVLNGCWRSSSIPRASAPLRLRARSAAVPRLVAPRPARAGFDKVRIAGDPEREMRRKRERMASRWTGNTGRNPGRRRKAEARTRNRAAARRGPMTRRDATLAWIRVWGAPPVWRLR